MTGKELFQYRNKLVRDTLQWKSPERTPISSNVTHWMFHDAGYSTGTAVRNYDIIEACMKRFVTKYPIDHLNVYNSGFRNYFLLSDPLDRNAYDGAGSDGSSLSYITEERFSPDEYDELTNEYVKTMWEKELFRRFPNAHTLTPKEFAQAAKTVLDYQEARSRIDTMMRDEYGVIVEKNLVWGSCSIEFLFDEFRGIKGLAMDLRRCPQKVKAFCEKNDVPSLQRTLESLSAYDGPNPEEPYDCMISMMSHTIMNRKNFETYIWPQHEKILQCAEAHHKQAFNYAQGAWERFGDLYNQFSKGTICMMVEQDDPFEIRKKYPNIAIYGGLNVSTMANGTEQQCIDMAKRAIDELGRDGGLILAPNKMVAYPNDMNPHNLEAVINFVHEYKR